MELDFFLLAPVLQSYLGGGSITVYSFVAPLRGLAALRGNVNFRGVYTTVLYVVLFSYGSLHDSTNNSMLY